MRAPSVANRAALQSRTSSHIQWVHHARWVVDGKFWTSSGVTAGLDMAFAWVGQLVGQDIADQICGVIVKDLL